MRYCWLLACIASTSSSPQTSQTLSLEKADTADPSPDESGDKFQLYFCWPISDREMSWWTLMGGLTRDRNFSIIRWSNALREFMFSVLTLDSSFKIKEDLALEITPAFSPAKWEVKFPDVGTLTLLMPRYCILLPHPRHPLGRGDHLALANSLALALPASENALLAN